MNLQLLYWPRDDACSLHLAPEVIHVWVAECPPADGEVGRYDQFLSAEERSRGESLRADDKRLAFLYRRGLLRVLLGRYLGCSPGDVPLGTEPQGKPMLQPGAGAEIAFSVSHTRNLAAFALCATRLVGVDVELLTDLPDAADLARLALTEQEQHALVACPEPGRARFFLNYWTAKEACLKALGCGLRTDPRQVSLDACPPGSTKARLRDGASALEVLWQVETFTPQPGYVASVAWLLTAS